MMADTSEGKMMTNGRGDANDDAITKLK